MASGSSSGILVDDGPDTPITVVLNWWAELAGAGR
jgi:hypothetical protein